MLPFPLSSLRFLPPVAFPLLHSLRFLSLLFSLNIIHIYWCSHCFIPLFYPFLMNSVFGVTKIKFEDYKVALNYFGSSGFIFSFDFKDGYYHIKINPIFNPIKDGLF
jgi:hypothetical protein